MDTEKVYHFPDVDVDRLFELYDWAQQLDCDEEFKRLLSSGATIHQLRLCCYIAESDRLELENNELREEIEALKALKGGE